MKSDNVESYLEKIRGLLRDCMGKTVLAPMLPRLTSMLGSGKMLRARMAVRIGQGVGLAEQMILHTGATVELVHAASLLHDDVIDGGELRRSEPSFWVKHGVSGAILLGDLLLVKAVQLMQDMDGSRTVPLLTRFAGEVCEAECEQELLLRGQPCDWEQCVSTARHKTGALFAFIGRVCGGTDVKLSRALEECGYLAGTAYQLGDDILDAEGDPSLNDKSLRRDLARAKSTASRIQPMEGTVADYINDLLASASGLLSSWPRVHQAWEEFVAHDIFLVIQRHLQK